MDSLIIVPLVCGVIYGTLTIVTLLRFTRIRLLFALYLFMATLWSLSSAITHLDINHQQTYFWAKMIVITGSPMVIFFYQFIRSYVKKPVNFWTYFGYTLTIVIGVLGISGVLLRDADFINGQLSMVYLPYISLILNLITFGYLLWWWARSYVSTRHLQVEVNYLAPLFRMGLIFFASDIIIASFQFSGTA